MKFRLFLAFLVGVGSAFNTFAINVSSRPLSAALITAGLYLISLFALDIKGGFYEVKRIGNFITIPFFYTLLLILVNIVFSNGNKSVFPFAFFMDWILFVAFLIHTYYDNRAVELALFGLSCGAIVLSVLFFFGIGVEVNLVQDGERLSMFGSNENVLGIIQSFSLCIILNFLILRDWLRIGMYRWLFVIPMLLGITMIIATGSRTAFIIETLVLFFSIVMFSSHKSSYKFFIILAGLCAFGIGLNKFMESDSTMLIRMISVVEERDASGRTYIWAAYLSKFLEHPIFGVGTTGLDDVARNLGLGELSINGDEFIATSPHNVFIEVLITTGLVGLILMLIFWGKILGKAFLSYKYNRLPTPLIMAIPIFMVLMTGQLLTEKYVWIVYAYMLTSYVFGSKKNIRI